jgi:hypothetical protein
MNEIVLKKRGQAETPAPVELTGNNTPHEVIAFT